MQRSKRISGVLLLETEYKSIKSWGGQGLKQGCLDKVNDLI